MMTRKEVTFTGRFCQHASFLCGFLHVEHQSLGDCTICSSFDLRMVFFLHFAVGRVTLNRFCDRRNYLMSLDLTMKIT